MTILDALIQLRNDLKLWVTNNLRVKLNKNLGTDESGKFLTVDETGEIVADDIGATKDELGYLSGVTSNVQEQLDGKADISHTHDEYLAASDIEGYATETYVDQAIANAQLADKEVDLSSYYTKTETDAKIDEAIDSIEHPTVDLTPYATTEYVNTQLENKASSSHTHDEYITGEQLDTKGYLTSIPDEYITETELNNKGYLTEHQDLSDYVKTADVNTTLGSYYTKTEIDNKGYAVATDVANTYATKTDISSKADTSYVDEQLTTKANTSHTHVVADITDIATTYLPLSGGTINGDLDITGSLCVGLENNGYIATESIYLGQNDDICLDYTNKSGYGNVLRIHSNIALTHNMLGKYDSNLGFGIASLGTDGKVPSSQLPSYVDDVVEGYYMPDDSTSKFWGDKSTSSSRITGETGKIYVDKDTGVTYRWSGSDFVEISSSLALGETSSTAFAGDRGLALEQTAIEEIWVNEDEPNTLYYLQNGEDKSVTMPYIDTTTYDTDKATFALKTDIPDYITTGAKSGTTIGSRATAEGYNTTASGGNSHAEGNSTTASGNNSHAEGEETMALGQSCHAEGYNTTASGDYSHAEGYNTTASGDYSHAEGSSTTASTLYSHAEGNSTTASGYYSHAEGEETTASGESSHTEGCSTITGGDATTYASTAAGTSTSTGAYAHAEGNTTIAKGNSSHAEGKQTFASNTAAHAEGGETIASGMYSHAEGSCTKASKSNSHAEGSSTTASGIAAHSEGNGTTASGAAAHAEGYSTTASGSYSHAAGYYTIANNYQYVVGKYNADTTAPTSTSDTSTDAGLFIVGIGTSTSNRSNGFRVTPGGKVYGTGTFGTSGADYAEYFEWLDGNPNNEDRRGRFVTLEGDKIRYATPNDDYILGVVSADPSVAGDVYSEDWHNRYLKDVFGSKIVEVVEVEETTNENGEIIPAHIERRWVLNPDYDPNVKYTSREERPEWAAIGLVGKLVVVDDGTCQVNSYCYPNIDGIATASQEKTNYRVMERLDDTHIRIFIR